MCVIVMLLFEQACFAMDCRTFQARSKASCRSRGEGSPKPFRRAGPFGKVQFRDAGKRTSFMGRWSLRGMIDTPIDCLVIVAQAW